MSLLIRCPECHSSEVETTDSGSVICENCGYILESEKNITANYEAPFESAAINKKLIRHKKKARIEERLTVPIVASSLVSPLEQLHEELFEIFNKFVQVFKTEVGVLDIDVEEARENYQSILQGLGARLYFHQAAGKIIPCLFASIRDPFITGSDVCHFSLTGLLDLLAPRFLGIEVGTHLQWLNSGSRDINWKAVAFRYTVLLCRCLKTPLDSLWRAVYLVLFTLNGISSLDCKDGFGLAAAVMSCVVLLKNWEKYVFACLGTPEFDAFRFCPLSLSSTPTTTLLKRMEVNQQERHLHYHRQQRAIRSVLPFPHLNPYLSEIVSSRSAKLLPEPTKIQATCSGTCLLKAIEFKRFQRLKVPHHALKIWLNLRNDFESLLEDDTLRALIGLLDLASVGLNEGLGITALSSVAGKQLSEQQGMKRKNRSHRSNASAQLSSEIEHLIAYLNSGNTEVLTSDADVIKSYQDDTQELMDQGCQNLLVCPRDTRPSSTPSASF